MTTLEPHVPSRLRRTQVATLARAEIRRSLLSRRSLSLYALISMPIVLMLLRAIFLPGSERADATTAAREFAGVFHIFLLRFIVYFANALVFLRLFRGEILERSLHYTLLAPIRRDVLVAGKYVGGLASSAAVLLATVTLTCILTYLPHGQAGFELLSSTTGVAHLARYLLVVFLACLAYGSFFLLIGLVFKNPMVPAIVYLGWEALTPFLPPFLKTLSIAHYLAAIIPVPQTLGAFALLADPIAWWIALPVLLAATFGLLAVAAQAARRLEITYSAE